MRTSIIGRTGIAAALTVVLAAWPHTVTQAQSSATTEAGEAVIDAAVEAGGTVVRTRAEEAAGRVFSED